MESAKKLSLKLPGLPQGKRKAKRPPVNHGEIVTVMNEDVISHLFGSKPSWPTFIDLSSDRYYLTNADFLIDLPNVVKDIEALWRALRIYPLEHCISHYLGSLSRVFAQSEFTVMPDSFGSFVNVCMFSLNLSNNNLTMVSMPSLDRLRRLWIGSNNGIQLSLTGLRNLTLLDVSHNLLAAIPDLSPCPHLQNINLAGNPLRGGYENFAKVKGLRVLDLTQTSNNYPVEELGSDDLHAVLKVYQLILIHLRKLAKLNYIAFEENDCEIEIVDFRLFVLSELPSLTHYNWRPYTKADRHNATKKDLQGVWKDKSKPAMKSFHCNNQWNNDDTAFIPSLVRKNTLQDYDSRSFSGSKTRNRSATLPYKINTEIHDYAEGEDPLENLLREEEKKEQEEAEFNNVRDGGDTSKRDRLEALLDL